MEKDLNYWKNNAEEDYMNVPISVLRYSTELEKVVLQADCKHEKVVDVRWCYKCTSCDKLLEAAN